ncbi:hypothetical protein, partial [Mesorhizobium sp.]|uniref:hypothetical protein n=1 Tax=Mesorhizobium sp. TaxID=1871066 RepID=UPI0025D66C6D
IQSVDAFHRNKRFHQCSGILHGQKHLMDTDAPTASWRGERLKKPPERRFFMRSTGQWSAGKGSCN